MAEQMTGWAGQPLKSSGNEMSEADAALLARLEGIQEPTPQDRGVLAALRIRTSSGTGEGMRVYSLTEKWNQQAADAKAAAQGQGQGQPEARFLR